MATFATVLTPHCELLHIYCSAMVMSDGGIHLGKKHGTLKT